MPSRAMNATSPTTTTGALLVCSPAVHSPTTSNGEMLMMPTPEFVPPNKYVFETPTPTE